MAKITSLTDQQWSDIQAHIDSVLPSQTDQRSDEEIRAAVTAIWKRMGHTPKAVLVADSPISGALMAGLLGQLYSQLSSQLYNQLSSQLYSQLRNQLRSQLDSQLRSQLSSQLYSQLYNQLSSQLYNQLSSQLYSQLRNQLDSQLRSQLYNQLSSQLYSQLRNQLDSQLDSQLRSQLSSQLYSQLRSASYVSIWWRWWTAWYRCGAIAGVGFDQGMLNDFTEWCDCVPQIYCFRDTPIVSRNPVEVHWQDGTDLHKTKGPAVRFRDGYSLWALNGVQVDEQIVMRPETQTLEQLRRESNAEIKRIRITRYGWSRWQIETGAKIIDTQNGDWMESLMRSEDGMTVLNTYDPSTGRPYSLEVDPQCETCEQAQNYLLAPEQALEGVGVTPNSTYPVLRT